MGWGSLGAGWGWDVRGGSGSERKMGVKEDGLWKWGLSPVGCEGEGDGGGSILVRYRG